MLETKIKLGRARYLHAEDYNEALDIIGIIEDIGKYEGAAFIERKRSRISYLSDAPWIPKRMREGLKKILPKE